jgi:hypothetical protein
MPIDQTEIKKILGNKDNCISFLLVLSPEKYDAENLNKLSANEIFGEVTKIWNFDKAKPIIRKLFRDTKKFKSGKASEAAIETLKSQWTSKFPGEKIDWPCSQGQFDTFVQRINSQNENDPDGKIKDLKVSEAAIKYRRLKELNTVRNDYLETLLFLKNEEIVPTLNHMRGVDFFIKGTKGIDIII